MENILTILAKKQSHFNKVSPDTTIKDALGRLQNQYCDYLIVLDDNDNFLGLLTEHEIVTRLYFNSNIEEDTTVKQIMNNRFPVTDAACSIEDCMRMMRRFNVRYLPVFEDLHFVGIISTDDILHQAILHRSEIFDKDDRQVYMEYAY